ncbi:poly [ADP-ribose] polymerase 14-like [Paramuricea clavata]|uniref:Poly [ADP-ribose] polymerase 14-like n=1 Tax=Paramuricea clavata TaxID=317549 RepID=A0A6S7JI81_PARCT|nr:poly [ADP-ribose] polymerase 14-like [Paramuricea clavata]
MGVSDGSQKRWRRKPASTSKKSERSVMCIEVGDNKKVEIVKGDITKETTDVIAHLTNPSLIMGSGVATALARAGGQEIERECKKETNSSRRRVATTVLTSAGQLDVKYIAHMVASNAPNSSEIEKCISDCLKVVSEEECESISFPAVGTGSLKHDSEKAATTIFKSVIRFLESSSGPLKMIRIVLKDDDLVTAFQASAKKLNEEGQPGMLKRLVNLFWKSDSTTITVKDKPSAITKNLFLEIYAKDNATINLAREEILKIIESQKKKERLEDDNIGKLSKHQITEIEHLCEMNDIKVTIEKDLNRIVVVGHSEDISKTFTEIFQILKRIGEAEKEKEKAALHADLAEIVSQGVQWFYVNPSNGDHEEYDKRTNATIEKAYSKKEKSVIFLLEDTKCEIVFAMMQETNLDTKDTLKVIRKDLKAEASVRVPEYWEFQPQDTNGKELAVHLVRLYPNDPNHKDEYKNISDHFQQTAFQQILHIHRIQNPSLFKQYLMKKQSLDEKSGSNEKFLFHGTRGDKLSEINKHGLNRSYAGNTNGNVLQTIFTSHAEMKSHITIYHLDNYVTNTSLPWEPRCHESGRRVVLL